MSEVTCPGTCCAAFRLPYTLTELRRGVNPDTGDALYEAEQIASMVIRLSPKEARERSVAFGGDGSGFPWSDRNRHFTCRHWDEETRLCGIYPDRPDMCRRYPYGRPCQHGCSCLGEAWPQCEAPEPSESKA